jgi:tetratricopeptide (TPR) repeat protein
MANKLKIHSLQIVDLMLCVLLSGCVNPFDDLEQKSTALALTGYKQYQSKNYADAERSYLSATELAIKSDNALQLPLMQSALARCYTAEKKYDQAEKVLREALNNYQSLSKQSTNARIDQSVVDERQYETLAALAENCMAQNKISDAKTAYADAIALSDKIVEPPSIAGQVKLNYIEVLKQCGERELANHLQRQLDTSTFTFDEFDERLRAVTNAISAGNYKQAEIDIETLETVSRGLLGTNSRGGKLLTLVALLKLIHNLPSEAEIKALAAIRINLGYSEGAQDRCADYTVIGLARELQGDTASSVGWYLKAFHAQPFNSIEVLSTVEKGMLSLGYGKEAQIAAHRIKSIESDPRFVLKPITALDFWYLANKQRKDGQIILSRETRLKALKHLESGTEASNGDEEMRGAVACYRHYRGIGEDALAARTLKAMRVVGKQSESARYQLDRVLKQFALPAN